MDGEFRPASEMTLQTTDVPFDLYRKDVEPGEIILGGNGGASSMYQVIAVRRAGEGGSDRTTVAQAMATLEDADPQRGRKLFFSNRATCTVCHKLEGRGIAVGPDLSDIGLRAEPQYVARSILEPNAKIIEGFLQASIRTTDGRQHLGMIRGESGQTLTLYTLDGRKQTIAKDEIADRELLDQSAMPPSFALLLSPQEVADLTAYLMTQKTEPNSKNSSVEKQQP
jgi:putative heme-binding domain-containing protein